MPFVMPGGELQVNPNFDQNLIFGNANINAAFKERQEIDRLREALRGININDPQSRVELAKAAEKNPLLSQLLPFDPGVVMRGAAESARENEFSAQQAIQHRVSRLLDSLVGPQSVNLGGGPSAPGKGGIFGGQTSFTNADLERVAPTARPQTSREAIETLRTEGLFNPADFLKNAEASVLGSALEKLGLGKGAQAGDKDFLKILLRELFAGKRAEAHETGVEKRHKEDIGLRQESLRAEETAGKPFENAVNQLSLKLQSGASREELDKIAAGLGFRITGIFRTTLDPFGIINIPGVAPQFTLEKIQRPAVAGRSAEAGEVGPAPKTSVSKSGRPIIFRNGQWEYND